MRAIEAAKARGKLDAELRDMLVLGNFDTAKRMCLPSKENVMATIDACVIRMKRVSDVSPSSDEPTEEFIATLHLGYGDIPHKDDYLHVATKNGSVGSHIINVVRTYGEDGFLLKIDIVLA